ncbi:protoporphyrinogen oxidase [Tomitella biformata]|uniref:protoporphyrinogen oxidase n=1 Tax=Tomitella biformata TaxID=630403 RepID=UPI0004666016|nr:protoporphyrinogen oxidase [Tomitella biformata]
MSQGVRIAVVGGGVTGLSAAHRLRTLLGPTAEILVLEAADRTGGKIRTVDLAGHRMDVGAEAFLARRPEMPLLLAELGLAGAVGERGELVHPSGLPSLIRSGAAAHPMPQHTLMGIPASAAGLGALVGPDTRARIAAERTRPLEWAAGDDTDVASLVSDRFGAEVTRNCVDPLLGGVYSGSAATIGVRAALPTLAAALDAGAASLGEAVERALPQSRPGPVFGAVRGGYDVLLRALEAAAAAEIRLSTRASGLTPSGDGWWLDPVGQVDAVILAVPAPELATLLGRNAVPAAAAAASIELASSAVVALALPPDAPLPRNSGMLVATGESTHAKACTLSSRKWPSLGGPDSQLLRMSFGRYGQEDVVDLPDAQLIALAIEDLRTMFGVTGTPLDAVVQRWHDGLPQYGPGHDGKVAAIESGVAALPGLAVAGALLRGVGVPACVAGGRAAAEQIVAKVTGRAAGRV